MMKKTGTNEKDIHPKEEEQLKDTTLENELEEAENQEIGGNEPQDLKNESQELDPLKKLEKELREKEIAFMTLNDQFLRLAAEFDNFRKRTSKEKLLLAEYASEAVIQALLPVLDDFERTLDAMGKTDNLASISDGIKLVNDKMHRELKKEGLIAIESKGKPFDSKYHEAISAFPVDEEHKKGIVIEEVEKGYMMKEKVIRFAKVIVGE